MPLEIEHRFLVDARRLPRPLPAGKRIVQGFLCLEPVVRVRLLSVKGRAPRAFLTVKGRGLRVREEFEYAIPAADARRLLRMCGARVIRKTRLNLGPWEVDRYAGRHRGLWLAEIELPGVRTPLPEPLPAWVGKEVTADPRYTNARLAVGKIPREAFKKR